MFLFVLSPSCRSFCLRRIVASGDGNDEDHSSSLPWLSSSCELSCANEPTSTWVSEQNPVWNLRKELLSQILFLCLGNQISSDLCSFPRLTFPSLCNVFLLPSSCDVLYSYVTKWKMECVAKGEREWRMDDSVLNVNLNLDLLSRFSPFLSFRLGILSVWLLILS